MWVPARTHPRQPLTSPLIPLADMLPTLLAERANLVSTADFNAHRHRCSRKIHKLRKHAGLVVRPSKRGSPKPKQGTAEILAWQSQRAWAAAMELRSALEARAGSGLRRQSLAKLAKAARFARQAAELEPSVSSLTLASLAAADLNAARNSWSIPREAYSEARLGLESFEDAVCSDYIQAHVDPALKLALSKTGGVEQDTTTWSRQHAKGTALGALVLKEKPGLLESAAAPSTPADRQIVWRGHVATIADPDLAALVLRARAADAALDPTEQALDEVIQLWATAVDAVREAVASAEPEDPLHIVATYAAFSLLCRRIQRDDLASATPDLAVSVRLLDNILQSCTELSELPGVYADELLGQSIDAMAALFKSRRLAALARAYAQRDQELEALKLVAQAEAVLQGADVSVVELPVTSHTVEQWRAELASDVKRAHGSALLASHSFKPVAANMAEFPAGPARDVLGRIVGSSLQLVPVKPVFYDLAYEFAVGKEGEPQAAPQQQAAEVASSRDSSPAPSAKKKGLFGLFK